MNRYFYKTIQLIMISLISSVVIPIVVFLFILLKFTLFLEIINQISQIVFYVITAVIAILTFRQAKKTIFSPMKKEMFKNQLDILKEHESIFWKTHNPDSLVENLFLSKILEYNFNYVILIEEKDNTPEITLYQMGSKGFIPVDPYSYKNQFIYVEFKKSKYNFNIHYEFNFKWKYIYNLSQSPLIPEEIQKSAKNFLNSMNKTMMNIQKFILEHYDDYMTDKFFPTRKKEKLLSEAKDELYDSFMTLNKSIREYMMTDKIMN